MGRQSKFLAKLRPRFAYQWPVLNYIQIRKMAKVRDRYNQAPHLIQDTNGKVTTSQLDNPVTPSSVSSCVDTELFKYPERREIASQS